jgi:hypothetical protein
MRIAMEVDGKVEWLKLPNGIEEIMNDGDAKNLFFGAVRGRARQVGATAVIFVNDAWLGEPTEKQKTTPPEELERVAKNASFQEMVDAGWVRRVEALIVAVYTPAETSITTQRYDRTKNGVIWGRRETNTFDQKHTTGRQKMFPDPVMEPVVQ